MEYPIFLANVIIRGKINCITGLHIGGSKDKMEIGGVDSPVIRNPQTNMPYIPGSSLKGKLRYLLEYSKGVIGKGGKKDKVGNLINPGDVSHDVEIVRLFGIGADDKESDLKDVGPTRLIVRDCYPDEKTMEMWKNMDSELLYTEYKPENTIDRLTAAANPRFIERVVAGSKFDFEIIYGIYQMSKEEKPEVVQNDLDNLMEALRILEHSAIGKSGTRGYGKIKFEIADLLIIKSEDYKSNSENYKKSFALIKDSSLKSLSEIKMEYK